MRADIVQMPHLEPYFGPRPPWISKGRRMVRLVRPMVVILYPENADSLVLRVPKGYISDRASVPRAAHWLMTPAGDLELASYPHDWLYSHGGGELGVDKLFADQVFKAVLRATPSHIPGWKIKAAYAAVRVGGRGGWAHGWGQDYGRSN